LFEGTGINEISFIQYQDYLKKDGSEVAPLPYLEVVELVDYPCEYKKQYVRIYKKKQLDSNVIRQCIYLYFSGSDATPQRLEILQGSRTNFYLQLVAKKLIEDYRRKYPGLQVVEEKQRGESLSEFW